MSCLSFCACKSEVAIPEKVRINPLQRVIRHSITVNTYSPQIDSNLEYRVSKSIVEMSPVLQHMVSQSIDGVVNFPATQLNYPQLKRMIKLIESEGKSLDPIYLQEDIEIMEFLEINNQYINLYVSQYIAIASYQQLLELWKNFYMNINKPNVIDWMIKLKNCINVRNCSHIHRFLQKHDMEKVLNLGEGIPYYHQIIDKIEHSYSMIPPKVRRASKCKSLEGNEKIAIF